MGIVRWLGRRLGLNGIRRRYFVVELLLIGLRKSIEQQRGKGMEVVNEVRRQISALLELLVIDSHIAFPSLSISRLTLICPLHFSISFCNFSDKYFSRAKLSSPNVGGFSHFVKVFSKFFL